MKSILMLSIALTVSLSAFADDACEDFTGHYVVEEILIDGGLAKVGDKAFIANDDCVNLQVQDQHLICDGLHHVISGRRYKCTIVGDTINLFADLGKAKLVKLASEKLLFSAVIGLIKKQAHIYAPDEE